MISWAITEHFLFLGYYLIVVVCQRREAAISYSTISAHSFTFSIYMRLHLMRFFKIESIWLGVVLWSTFSLSLLIGAFKAVSFLILFFFNWRIIALQHCVGFFHTLTWISHMSPHFWMSFPSPTSSHPSRLLQNPSLSSLSHAANSHWTSILHMIVYIPMLLSPLVPHSLSYPHPQIHKSVLYVCVSISALQIGSPVLSF